MDMVITAEKSDISGHYAPPPQYRPLPPARKSRPEHSEDASPPPSQFEQLAAATAGISRNRLKLLGLLLAAGSATSCCGQPVLRPIWATEALHRAYNMAKLVGRLEQNAPRRPPDFETPLGVELASIFDSLAISSDQEPRSCSAPLRDLTRDLTELFGPAIGQIAVTTNVDRLTLPAFRHRALILMANELVTNALLHAFKDRRFGRITLQLSVLARGSARLTVMDDGESARHQPSPCSVINYLADLLESDLVYQTRFGGGLIAEIEIPL